jgi:lipopolysaccharide export system permease protein
VKIADKLVVRSFAGPYVLSFFIAEFVLVMQLMWKYVDEILGKGVTVLEIMELVFYFGVTMIPQALPISILIASVMVFGNMSEKYEVTSLKSAGVSFMRIMYPAIGIAVITALFSVFASNYMKPTANFQFRKSFDTIRRQKPMLSLSEGVFNEDFLNYRIRLGEKVAGGNAARDIILYDHSNADRSALNMIIADSASMYYTPDGKLFIMKLINGVNNQELERQRKDHGGTSFPFMRTEFDSWTKAFDMSEFYLDKDDLGFSRREDMLNFFQLRTAIDTVDAQIMRANKKLPFEFKNLFSENLPQHIPDENRSSQGLTQDESTDNKAHSIDNQLIDPKQTEEGKSNIFKKKSKQVNDNQISNQLDTLPQTTGIMNEAEHSEMNEQTAELWQTIHQDQLANVITRALTNVGVRNDGVQTAMATMKDKSFQRGAYLLRMHQQFSFAFICILFVFIGAPLGSIIRKGGYGYPVLLAIIFYMVFIIASIFAEKMYKNQSMTGVSAAWFPCLLLLPFSILFTVSALNDVKFQPVLIFRNFIDKIRAYIERTGLNQNSR